jgi:hypothetical protein
VGVFGGFIYGGEAVGGDVYGPDVDVLAADLISADAVRINLDAPVVVDDAYKDPTNYSVSVISGPGQTVAVRSVLPIFEDTTSEIILVIDKVSKGTTYEVSVDANVTGVSGQGVAGAAQFVGRRTKTENMCRGLPAHFNVLPESCIRNVLTAIGLADEDIGGSLDEPS